MKGRAGPPGSLCYGAGNQQEVSPRVRRGHVVPRQEVSDSRVVSSSLVGLGACPRWRCLWGSKWPEGKRTQPWSELDSDLNCPAHIGPADPQPTSLVEACSELCGAQHPARLDTAGVGGGLWRPGPPPHCLSCLRVRGFLPGRVFLGQGTLLV